MSDYRVVKTYEEVRNSISNFNRDLKGSDVLKSRLSSVRAWYYVPEEDAVGPSKFIGYNGMTEKRYVKFTSGEYKAQKGTSLDGKETEPALRKWFRVLEDGEPGYTLVKTRVEELLKRSGRHVGSKARFCVPKEWNALQFSAQHDSAQHDSAQHDSLRPSGHRQDVGSGLPCRRDPGHRVSRGACPSGGPGDRQGAFRQAQGGRADRIRHVPPELHLRGFRRGHRAGSGG